MRRRVYADLKRRPEEQDEARPQTAPATAAEPEPDRAPPAESPHARLIALQRGAGNAATGRLLRTRAAQLGLAREPEGAADAPAADAPLDVHAMTARYFEQLRNEDGLLHGVIVPRLLTRLAAPPRIGTSESLAELTLLARDELERYLRENNPQGAGAVRVVSPVAEIQRVVIAIARERNIMVPGHRAADDTGGLESEAKALADLAGAKLPDFAIEASAAGFKFRFDGELAASRKVGGADLSLKAGAGGVEGTVKGADGSITAGGSPSAGKVEGRLGPVTAGGSVAKDSAKLDLKIAAGAVEFKGSIAAKAGQPTTWSAALEIKIDGGANPVPDPSALAEMIQAAGHDVVEAAQYLGSAVAGSADVDKTAIEQKLKPAKDSIEKVAGYIEKHKAKPASGPGATIGVTAKGEAGGLSGMITLTITF